MQAKLPTGSGSIVSTAEANAPDQARQLAAVTKIYWRLSDDNEIHTRAFEGPQ